MTRETHYERMIKMLPLVRQGQIQKYVKACACNTADLVWKALPLALGLAVDEEGRPLVYRHNTGKAVEDFPLIRFEILRHLLDNQTHKYSFGELMTGPNYPNLVAFLMEVVTEPEAASIVQVDYHMSCHERAGKRVYDVSPGLAQQLRYTEIRGIYADDLRLPYEAIYIQVPEQSGLKVWNQDSGWHNAVGAYIVEDNQMSEVDRYEQGGDPGSYRGWRFLLIGEDRGFGDDALEFFRVLLKAGEKLEDVVARCKREMVQFMEETPFTVWDGHMEQWEQRFKWCMNVVLYATWTEPGELWIANKEARKLWERVQKCGNNKRKRKALSKRFQTLDPMRRIKLGSKIVIDRKSGRNGDEKSGSGGPENPINILRVKTRVTGHWKHVVHGPKHSLRRYQWIEPHWRHKDGLEPVIEVKRELR
jgi:hypothetical protein